VGDDSGLGEGRERGGKNVGKEGKRKRKRKRAGERTRWRGWATAIYRDARNFLVNAHVNRHVAYALCTVYSASCTAERGARGRRGHETMKNARATIYYLRVQVTTAEQAQSLPSLPLPLSL